MTALAADVARKSEVVAFAQRTGNYGSGTIDATDVFYIGALAMYDTSDDEIKPGATSTTGVALGVVTRHVGVGEDRDPVIVSGCFPFANSAGGDAVADSDAGSNCYIVDDNTVMITATGKSVAGKVVRVDADGVWVSVNPY